MAKKVYESEDISAIADAIREKNGSETRYKPRDMAEAVRGISGGVTTVVPRNDINFFDYDGTIIESWSMAELAGKTALPKNPTHEGLISQGWNWTLAELKAENAPIDVGQMYITDDGKTRYYITIPEKVEGRMDITTHWKQTVSNGVVVDWGDGSATTTVAGTGTKEVTHIYADKGDYVIAFNVASNCTMDIGGSNMTDRAIGKNNTNRYQYYMLKKVEIGARIGTINNTAFQYCTFLGGVTMPMNIVSIGNSCFNYCEHLKCITIPRGMVQIGQRAFLSCNEVEFISIPKSVEFIFTCAFGDCNKVQYIRIPSGVETLGEMSLNQMYSLRSFSLARSIAIIDTSLFSSCYSLSVARIPSSVSIIRNSAFAYCCGLVEVHVERTTPPTVGTNSFIDCNSNLKIYVPPESVDAYKAATNWSALADKIFAEEV